MPLLTILNIIYVIVAIAMIGFILIQRGAGAQAGSGFGAGASATVFGARGAGNFMTKSTAILAATFFLLSLGMGIYVARMGGTRAGGDVGVMDELAPAAPAPSATLDVPAAPGPTPGAPASDVPAAATGDVPAAAASDVPPVAATEPAPAAPVDDEAAEPDEKR